MRDRIDDDFIKTKLPAIEGWLENNAAFLTAGLVRAQDAARISGGFFEIGVYAGKYLSLLYHLSQNTGAAVLGLDTFQWYPKSSVERNFAKLFGVADHLTLTESDSTKISGDDVLKLLKARPRFISVDGAHTSPAVLGDLKLSESILADGGLVAIDDLLNPRAIGVSEGAYRYFLSRAGQGLVPFAYCANKLFACRPGDCPHFRKATEAFLDGNPDLEMSTTFQTYLKQGRHWVEQDLFGVPVFIL